MQEAADEVVIVIAAVDRKIDVQAGTAAERDGGDACFGGIGRLHRSGERRHQSNVGEAARGERHFVEIIGSDYGLYGAAGSVERMAGERWTAIVHFYRLTQRFRSEDDANDRLCADGDGYTLRLLRESARCDFHGVGGGSER